MENAPANQPMPAVAPETVPGPIPSARETDLAPQPHLKLVMWEHSKENNDNTVKQLQDCDVVAFEHRVFKNNEERQAYDRAATTYVSTTATDEERRKAYLFLDKFDHTAPQYKLLLDSLKGSDKRIVTLDMNKDDPDYKPELNTEKAVSLNASKMSVGEIKTTLVERAAASAKWDEAREARMVAQVTDLVGEYSGQEVNIAIMVGAAHTPVHHQLAKQFPGQATRVFATPVKAGQTRPERTYYDPISQLRRHARLVPDKPVPDAMLDRAVLQALEHDSFSLFSDAQLHSRAIENLSDAAVSELVVALDGLKTGLKANLLRRVTARRAGKIIAAKVAEQDRLKQAA